MHSDRVNVRKFNYNVSHQGEYVCIASHPTHLVNCSMI